MSSKRIFSAPPPRPRCDFIRTTASTPCNVVFRT
jgi:hypothetical protein